MNMGRRTAIKLALALVVTAAASAGATPASASETAALTIRDFSFSPATLTIPVGTTVAVTNEGESAHTWSSDPGEQTWNSGNLDPGASYSVTFSASGTFSYHCNIHSFMTGTIVVTGGPPISPPSTAPPVTTTPVTPAAVTPATGTPSPPPPSGAAAAPIGARPTALPHTGASKSTVLAASAVALTLLGAALMFVASTMRRRRGYGR